MKIVSLFNLIIFISIGINLSAQPAGLSADNSIIEVKLDLTRGGARGYA